MQNRILELLVHAEPPLFSAAAVILVPAAVAVNDIATAAAVVVLFPLDLFSSSHNLAFRYLLLFLLFLFLLSLLLFLLFLRFHMNAKFDEAVGKSFADEIQHSRRHPHKRQEDELVDRESPRTEDCFKLDQRHFVHDADADEQLGVPSQHRRPLFAIPMPLILRDEVQRVEGVDEQLELLQRMPVGGVEGVEEALGKGVDAADGKRRQGRESREDVH